MSFKGPIPKDPKLRQRRNKVATAAQLCTGRADVRIPRLPKRHTTDGKEIPWLPLTRAWWKDIWRSPMAAEYLDADKHALYRLAALVNDFWAFPTKELGAEIRLEQMAFGLTPIDRRRLQWSVNESPAKAAKNRTEPVQEQPSGKTAKTQDPRSVLEQWVVAPESEQTVQ